MNIVISAESRRRFAWVSLLSFLIFIPSGAAASVLGEARFLMRSPRDLNADGFLSNAAGELPDALRASDPQSDLNGSRSNALDDNLAAILISNEDVLNPYTGFVDENVPCLKLTGSPKADGSGITYRPQSVQLPSLFDYTYTNDYSFAVRFRYDGEFVSGGTSTAWNKFLCFGSNDVGGGGGSGLSFGFKVMNENYAYYWFSFGGFGKETYVGGIGTNQWLEVVGVMDAKAKKLFVYTAYPADNFRKHLTHVYDYPESTENVTVPYSSVAKIGYTDHKTWSLPSGSMQSYRGSVARLAIWDRALTEEEALEVMGSPHRYSWQVGEDNGTAGEFAGTASGVRRAAGQDWSALPHEISAQCGNFEVSFPHDRGRDISEEYPVRNTLVTVKAADDSGAGRIRLSVNGNKIKDVSVTAGMKYAVLVKSEFLQDDNVLSVTHLSGEAVKFDYVAGGGSWQVGYRDNDYTNDGFAGQGNNLHRMENFSFATFSRCLAGPENGDLPVDFLVDLPEEFCGRMWYNLEIRWWHWVSGTVRNSVFLNGTSLGEIPLNGTKTTTVIRIPRGLLKEGLNHFQLVRTGDEEIGAADWDPIDYVMLEPCREFTGTVMVLK